MRYATIIQIKVSGALLYNEVMTKPIFIVFDCFGVLYVDAFNQFLDAYAQKLPHDRNHYYDLAKQNDHGYLSDEDLYQELETGSGVPADTLKKQFNNTNCLNTNLVPLISELREKHGYKIGMLSNVDLQFLQRFLDNHNIRGLFDCILTSSESVHSKPDREIFEELANRAGDIPFDQWYFTDDASVNVTAAQSYGIRSHLFVDAAGLRQDLQNAGIL
jgi:HAD superfamily hydrolase (TIGR01549 family)